MSPLEEFAAMYSSVASDFHLFQAIQTVQSNLNEIEIIPGQWILCTDTKEYYNDVKDGVRIKISDTIVLESEDDRTGTTIPINGKFYLVKGSGILYQYNNDTWNPIKTTASSVITEDGSTVEEKLQTISKIGRTVSYVEVETDGQTDFTVPFPFENYLSSGNFMEIRIGSVYVDERRYVVDEANSTITFDSTMELTAGRTVTFVFWYNSYLDTNYIPQISNIPADRIVLSDGRTVEEVLNTLLASNG